MKSVTLKIKKPNCDDKSCPMPLEFLPNLEKGIKSVKYSEKTGVADIEFDEKIIPPGKLVTALRKMGYDATR